MRQKEANQDEATGKSANDHFHRLLFKLTEQRLIVASTLGFVGTD